MKNIIIISLLLVLMSVKGFSQSNYNDYSENDKEKIFSDDFSTNNNAWSVGNFDCKIYTHSPGYFEMKSTCPDRATGHLVNYRNEFIINQTRNFEIETSIALISGDEIQSNGIAWGQNNMDNYFIFMFSANGTYSIYKRYNGTWETWKEVTSTSLIKKNNFNKLTIRKIDNKFYFFINNGFVHSCSFEPFLGQMLMFQGAQNSTIRIDYINISYLEKQQIVLSDYIAPEITITEP
ncbi:MAG: hypothetical protein JXR51_16915, partial [Bacteroidales bacterium]|nr:hypothetical protein [Bacteroidales bacterium]